MTSETAPGSPVTCCVFTCPRCRQVSIEQMPTDACIYLYECPHCKVLLNPKSGDCCVFCSYGSVPCPPRQISQSKDPCCK